jgi:hypothetical protein
MSTPRHRITFVIPALLLFASSASAQTAQPKAQPTLRSVVRQGSTATYFDLVKIILPDLQSDASDPNSATAHRTIPIRNIEEKEAENLEGDFSISSFGTRWTMSDGRQVMLLQLDLTAEGLNEATPYQGEASLLAAFAVDPTPKLLDVMDIKTDRFTDFWEQQPVFPLNSQNGAFVIHNTHWNSGESYNDIRVLFLRDGRFDTITSVFLLNTQGCAADITETPYFRALPDTSKYPKVLVKVTLKKAADKAECSRRTPGYTRYYQEVFYWNPVKAEYQGNARQLNALDKFNRARL